MNHEGTKNTKRDRREQEVIFLPDSSCIMSLRALRAFVVESAWRDR